MSFLNSRRIVLASFACLWLNAAWADQIVLKNGDRVTGGVIKKDGKTLTLKTDHLGAVTMPWDQVQSITTEKPVTVVLQDGRTVKGTLATADGNVVIATETAKVGVTPGQIATIRNADEQKAYERLLKPAWDDLWAGNASLGFAGTVGNAETQTFSVGTTVARATNNDKTSLYFNAIKASASANGKNSDTAQAVRGGWAYNHNFAKRVFASGFNDYEFDKFQDLNLRFVIGGGVGYQVVKGERASLNLLAGADFNRSAFTTLTQKSAEFYWGDGCTLKLSAVTMLTQSFRMFDDLTYTGTYRVNGDLTASTKLKKWLTWNLSVSDRYLSNPAPGRKTNDFLYTTGLGIAFAQ
jgi:putative salt-induced outer membrane protein YdiY